MEMEPLPLVVYVSEHPTLYEGALSEFMKLSNDDNPPRAAVAGAGLVD